MLYTEGLITEDTQRKIERCGGSLSDTLRELMIAVSDDHSKLRSLGNILMELEETKPLAQDIIRDCGKYPCIIIYRILLTFSDKLFVSTGIVPEQSGKIINNNNNFNFKL